MDQTLYDPEIVFVSPAVLRTLELISQKNPAIYLMDVKLLMSLARLPRFYGSIEVLQEHFSRGQDVPIDIHAPREVQEFCYVLYDWINNTNARLSHFRIAEYIHACYARKRSIPLIPNMLAPLFNQSNSIKTKALEYYFDVWKNLAMPKDMKRCLFLLTCRGHRLRFSDSSGNILRGNSLRSHDLPAADYSQNTWCELENCRNIFEMFYAYSAFMRSSYLVRTRSRKRPKTDDKEFSGQTSAHLTKRDLFFQFQTWVEETHPRFAIYIIEENTNKNGRVTKFFDTLLWHIVLQTPMHERLHGVTDPEAIEIVPLLNVPK